MVVEPDEIERRPGRIRADAQASSHSHTGVSHTTLVSSGERASRQTRPSARVPSDFPTKVTLSGRCVREETFDVTAYALLEGG